jgi:E3 ubiquitin-protein ligase HUWE1
LKIKFKNERGIDNGGLGREWFSSLFQDVFSPRTNFFEVAPDGATYQPSQRLSETKQNRSFYIFIGRMIGKIIAEGLLIESHLSNFILKFILGMSMQIEDV